MLSISDLLTTPTEDAVFEAFLTDLEGLGVPARSWKEAGVGRSILRVAAKAYAAFAAFIEAFIRSGFLETAEGDWLTLLARYVYGVERRVATFASGSLTLTNAGGGIYAFSAGEVRALRTVGDTVYAYTNAAAFTLDPGQTVSVAFSAVVAGSASSAPPGTVVSLETVLTGVSVTNPVAIVGSDAQPDSELRLVCLDKLASLSMSGPGGAYGYAVRTATLVDGSPANINRFARAPDSSVGIVTIYCASPSGSPSAEDLQAVRDRIEAVFARPDSVTVSVLAATPVAFTRTVTVWARATPGLRAEDVSELVGQALLDYLKAYPIGGIKKPPSSQGYLYADAVASAALRAHASIFDVDFDVASDMPLAAGEVASLATTISVRIVEVP